MTNRHQPLHLTKHHGLGNDFLVALAAGNPSLDPAADRARELCDRHRGLGADGFIWGLAPAEPENDLRLVLHNADGSEAEISGNGIRCLGQAFLRDRGERSGVVLVETSVGLRRLTCAPTDDDDTDLLEVSMGAVGSGPEVPSATIGRRQLSLSVGNPHLVIEVDDLSLVDPAVLGPQVEAGVPGGINVHFLVPDGPDAIRLLHWERGAGVTEACGSGAVAAGVAAIRWGLAANPVTVRMPGGDAVITAVDDGATTLLRGPATYVAEVWA